MANLTVWRVDLLHADIAELIKKHDQYISPYLGADETADELDHANQTLLDIAALVGVHRGHELTHLLAR